LGIEVARLVAMHHGRYGSPRITAGLSDSAGPAKSSHS
jgi:hypothetical protein